MSSPAQLLNEGLAHHQAGRLDAARSCYQQSLKLNGSQPDALHLLGVVVCQQGDNEEAIVLIRRAIALQPNQPTYHSNLGNAFQQLGRLPEAVAAYGEAIRLQPGFADAYSNSGHALRKLGRMQEAIAAFQQAMQLKPGYVDACNGLGSTLRALGRLSEAEKCYRTAIDWQPSFVNGYTNLANTLRDLGRWDEAIDCFHQALAIKPDSPEVLASLGNTCREDGRYEEAREAYGKAADLEPENLLRRLQADTLCPTVLPDDAAIDAYRGELVERIGKLRAEAFVLRPEHIRRVGGEPPLNLQCHGRDDRPLREAYAGLFKGAFPEIELPKREGKPTLGFVVTAHHERAFVRSMAGIIERLPGDSYDVEILCPAESVERIRAGIHREGLSIIVIPAEFEAAAQTIAACGCDVLYYWEVGTDAVNYFLPFMRLAPVQCTSWGIQVTSGIPTMDYYLSSELIEPEGAAAHYSEQLLLMRGIPSYQSRIVRPEAPRDRASLGLPEGGHVYLCPQQLGKFHPEFDHLLADILRQDPQGVVVVTEGRSAREAAALRRRWEAAISDVAQRVVFVPSQRGDDYASLLLAADVLLDTLHYGGVNTTYDALSLGKAVVTLPGEFQRGRYTLGCYRHMNYLECVATDRGHYASLAVRLASDPAYRAEVEAEILRRGDSLFDDHLAVDEHHRCFMQLIALARE